MHPVGKGHGNRWHGAVHPVYRVGWTWKFGPGKDVYLPPLPWAERQTELAELRAGQDARKDYVSAERRAKLAALLRQDPEQADREIARRSPAG